MWLHKDIFTLSSVGVSIIFRALRHAAKTSKAETTVEIEENGRLATPVEANFVGAGDKKT